jgi:co-chaperonin GroES (HSP10)
MDVKVGDYMLAGKHHGKIKAMHDERGYMLLLRVLRLGFSSWS